MDAVKIALADGDESACRLLEMALTMEPDFQVTAVTHSGQTLLQQLKRQPVDLVMLDLCLADGCGLEILETLLRWDIPPKVLVTGSAGSQALGRRQGTKGLSYLRKPFTLGRAVTELRLLLEEREVLAVSRALERQVGAILEGLHAPAHRKGYYPLKMAIAWAAENPDCTHGVMMGLYGELAARCGSTVSQVERNLRGVIGDIWRLAEPEVLGRYLNRPPHQLGEKPGNVEFISALAQWVRGEGTERQREESP